MFALRSASFDTFLPGLGDRSPAQLAAVHALPRLRDALSSVDQAVATSDPHAARRHAEQAVRGVAAGVDLLAQHGRYVQRPMSHLASADAMLGSVVQSLQPPVFQIHDAVRADAVDARAHLQRAIDQLALFARPW